MNLNSYQTAWQAQQMPVKDEVKSIVENILRAERRHRIVLINCAVNTSMAMLLVLYILLFRRPLAPMEVVPALLLQGGLAAVLVTLIRRQEHRRRAIARAMTTVRESAKQGLDNVRDELRDMLLLAGVMCGSVPLFGFIVYQLVLAGKMNQQAAMSFSGVGAVVLMANGFMMWRKYQRKILPRRNRLTQIMQSIEE